MNRKQIGVRGEQLAAATLEKKGLVVLERNFSNRYGELDIIARDGKCLVFVEVKTKTGTLYGSPEEMISPQKLLRVRRMATIYMANTPSLCRIDVIAIVLKPDGNPLRLTHYENVV